MYEGESDSLEAAQQRKLEYHIRQARADGAARVLDIGCGWGALQKRLVTEHKVKVAVGLKISSPKAICHAWERSPTHLKEFSKSFRLETIVPITNVQTANSAIGYGKPGMPPSAW